MSRRVTIATDCAPIPFARQWMDVLHENEGAHAGPVVFCPADGWVIDGRALNVSRGLMPPPPDHLLPRNLSLPLRMPSNWSAAADACTISRKGQLVATAEIEVNGPAMLQSEINRLKAAS